MSLNIITVTLNMGEASGGPRGGRGAGQGAHRMAHAERHHFLGISIVGQSNDRGDGGIYIGSIMKGGAVAADGRIEPGDMLLQVRAAGGCWGAGRSAPPRHSAEPLPPGERRQLREHEQRRRCAGAAGDRVADGVRPEGPAGRAGVPTGGPG